MSESGVVQNVFGYDSAPIFANQYKQWEQYAVLGVLIRWTPSNLIPTATNFICNPIQMWTDPNTYGNLGITETKLIQHSAYRSLNPRRGFKMYFSNRTLAQQGRINWADSRDYAPGVAGTYPFYDQDGLARACVNFRFTTKGVDIQQPVPAVFNYGSFEIVHYLRFRGQTNNP
jgi:hypothetical protein